MEPTMHTLKAELPDLFQFTNGERVHTVADWRRRRDELQEMILSIEYGHLPPVPTGVRAEVLHPSQYTTADGLKADHCQYRLVIEGGAAPFWFIVDVMVPKPDGETLEGRKLPVVINGDGCWSYLKPEIVDEVLRRGYILATFNRTEIVPDAYNAARDTALYLVYPDGDFGALAAWAWGYHRVVDFLLTLDYVNPEQIAVVGHSRGGKTVLVAGATDERIALTAPNNSGSGGAGSYLWQGQGEGERCEKLRDGMEMVPYWYVPRLGDFIDKEEELPFDQHALKALVAPRALLSTEALGDGWANPTGTYQTYLAAREAYRFLGAEERIGIWYREGEHNHGPVDWSAFLDFADLQFRGIASATRFNENPFPGMASAFSWSA
jgi:hypothetical protein